MAQLVDRLTERLAQAGVEFRSTAVTRLERDGRTWRADPPGAGFDAVIVATPAAAAARILGPDGPPGLSAIEAASVVLVTLGYGAVELPVGINGVLVPARSGWLMTACSFGSAKWPHWAGPGRTVLRVSAGRDGDDRALMLTDDELVDRLSEEVMSALGTSARPDSWRVSRYPDSFPQYRVGHAELVSGVAEGLRRSHPGVRVCGASYHGAGIPACVASGRAAARSLLQSVSPER
jgi:oxygen-dependent protoporphyrinogen oxidase